MFWIACSAQNKKDMVWEKVTFTGAVQSCHPVFRGKTRLFCGMSGWTHVLRIELVKRTSQNWVSSRQQRVDLTLILFFFFQVQKTFKASSVGPPIEIFEEFPSFCSWLTVTKFGLKSSKNTKVHKRQQNANESANKYHFLWLFLNFTVQWSRWQWNPWRLRKTFITIWFLRLEFYREFNKNFGADGFW